MEIMQLRYLKEVARQESFTRAAELLHITQSALSKSIAKLEDEVGVKLFERDGNRIHLNPFGKAILQMCIRDRCRSAPFPPEDPGAG